MARGHDGLASRLYRGDADLNIIGRRKIWYTVFAAILLVAALSFGLRGFTLGVDFSGGNSFQVPASVGTLSQVTTAVGDSGATVVSSQRVGGAGGQASYLIRTKELSAGQEIAVKQSLASQFSLPASQISDERVSGSWGAQITKQALIGVIAFLVAVVAYLIIRFRDWRFSVAAIAALVQNLLLSAAIYSLVGFEVTPNTVIGFLTILGFALYDVVVVFDKVRENTRSLTSQVTQTYGEAANLAVNQTLMRSINTSLVALLPVGGLLFIGAGLLGAGTLKDLGLVLFVGMLAATFSSIFLATPVLVDLKEREPKFAAHRQRVLARRTALAAAPARSAAPAKQSQPGPRRPAPSVATSDADDMAPAKTAAPRSVLAGSTPRVGAKPSSGKRPGGRGGRPGSGKRRR